MTLFYILIAAIFLAIAFEIGGGIQKRKHKKWGDNKILQKEIKRISAHNPALKFPIPAPNLLKFNSQQIKTLGLVLRIRQEDLAGSGIIDFLHLLPETITPGKDLMSEGEEDYGEKEYHLVFDQSLRPRYVRFGYEGEEDSLPYSEYGDDKWWWEQGWKQTRPKTPEIATDATITTIRFLIEYGFIKIPS